MQCPDCGYMLSAFDKDCARCRQYAARGLKPPAGLAISRDIDPEPAAAEAAAAPAFCHRCSAPMQAGMRYCPSCGLDTAAPAGFSPPAYADASPNHGLIFIMWFLTVISWACGLAGGLPLGLCIDLVAVVMAFVLTGSRAPADKSHGRAKLWLELIAFLIAFFVSCSASQSRYGSGY